MTTKPIIVYLDDEIYEVTTRFHDLYTARWNVANKELVQPLTDLYRVSAHFAR